MGNLWANGTCPLDWPLRFRDDVVCGGPFVGNHIERTSDLAEAVEVLRQQGITVSFPMQTAVGDFTLTADQMLELLEREELHAEGVRRLVEAQAEKQRRLAILRPQAASSQPSD